MKSPAWKPTPRLVGYIRQRADHQAGELIKGQRASLERLAKMAGGELHAVFCDIGSVRDARRPGLDGALDHLKANGLDGLVVWRFDRLARDGSRFEEILSRIEACGARLFSSEAPGGTKRDPVMSALLAHVANHLDEPLRTSEVRS